MRILFRPLYSIKSVNLFSATVETAMPTKHRMPSCCCMAVHSIITTNNSDFCNVGDRIKTSEKAFGLYIRCFLMFFNEIKIVIKPIQF